MPTAPPTPPVPPSPRRSARQSSADRRVATFLVAQATSTIAVTLQAAVLGKQVYDITDSTVSIGLLGLVEFAPALLVVPLTGSAADRFDRRHIVGHRPRGPGAGLLDVVLAYASSPTPPASVPIFLIAVLFGTARAFVSPAMRSIPPLVAADLARCPA